MLFLASMCMNCPRLGSIFEELVLFQQLAKLGFFRHRTRDEVAVIKIYKAGLGKDRLYLVAPNIELRHIGTCEIRHQEFLNSIVRERDPTTVRHCDKTSTEMKDVFRICNHRIEVH